MSVKGQGEISFRFDLNFLVRFHSLSLFLFFCKTWIIFLKSLDDFNLAILYQRCVNVGLFIFKVQLFLGWQGYDKGFQWNVTEYFIIIYILVHSLFEGTTSRWKKNVFFSLRVELRSTKVCVFLFVCLFIYLFNRLENYSIGDSANCLWYIFLLLLFGFDRLTCDEFKIIMKGMRRRSFTARRRIVI